MIKNIVGYILASILFLGLLPYFIWLVSQIFVARIFENQILAFVFGTAFIIIGAIYVLLSNIQMRVKGKGNPVDAFNISVDRTKNLMTSGVYKHTRNPMLFGVFALYIGVALIANSYAALLVPIIFISYMIWHVRRFEEPRLARDFGEEYIKYKAKTPMIVPFVC